MTRRKAERTPRSGNEAPSWWPFCLTIRGMPLEGRRPVRCTNVRQLGSAVVAVTIMLASAAFSEQLVPAVKSQEPVRMPLIVADTVPVMPLVPETAELPPRVPEQLVMLVVGSALIGLGGASRPRRPRR